MTTPYFINLGISSFSHQLKLMVFQWSLSERKSPQVFTILLNILNNAVVWMVWICPPISNSSSLPPKPLETVPNVPVTISNIVTLMFHSFF